MATMGLACILRAGTAITNKMMKLEINDLLKPKCVLDMINSMSTKELMDKLAITQKEANLIQIKALALTNTSKMDSEKSPGDLV